MDRGCSSPRQLLVGDGAGELGEVLAAPPPAAEVARADALEHRSHHRVELGEPFRRLHQALRRAAGAHEAHASDTRSPASLPGDATWRRRLRRLARTAGACDGHERARASTKKEGRCPKHPRPPRDQTPVPTALATGRSPAWAGP